MNTLSPFTGMPVTLYGHSMLKSDGQGRTANASWADLLALDLNMGAVRNCAGSQQWYLDLANAANSNNSTKWTPGSTGLVCIDAGLVDLAAGTDSEQRRDGMRWSLRHLLHNIGSASVIEDNNFGKGTWTWTTISSATFSGGNRTWTLQSNAELTIPYTGTKGVVTLFGFDDAGALAANQSPNPNQGGVAFEIRDENNNLLYSDTTSNRCCKSATTGAWWMPMAFPIDLAQGSHVIKIINKSGVSNRQLWVEGFRIPGNRPLAIVKGIAYCNTDYYTSNGIASVALIDAYNAEIESIVGEFPNTLYLDPNADFDVNTMITSNVAARPHANDIAHSLWAGKAIELLSTIDFNAGLNVL